MNTGGFAQMSYNNADNSFSSGGFNPAAGFNSRAKGPNPKRLSVALPPKFNAINEDQAENPLPRATSRSHLLAGLRTAPKSPSSAPYNQTQHDNSQWGNAGYDSYSQQTMPHTAMASNFGMNQYVMNAGQQTYALPEQVLAPPSLYDQEDEDMDPNVLEQLQLTGLFLAQRQQQLQQQLANITAAAHQFQGVNANMLQQQQMAALAQQQMQGPIEVAGQPGLYLVYNPAIGQYQYVQQQQQQPQQQQQQNNFQQQAPRRTMSPMARSGTMPNLSSGFESPRPIFRSEVTPPPMDTPMQNKRSITPPKKSNSPQTSLEHVVPLPPPSANAFRRSHKKVGSLSLQLGQNVQEGPKTSSAAVFGANRPSVPAGPMTGTFGPGAARAGEHPIRQPRGPPPLEELVALPTANHEGSKNFAARRRRRALDGLMRASSVRRSLSNPSASSPTAESEASLQLSEEDEPGFYRKQSPIGSERSAKRGSQSSFEGSAPNSAVQTPATEDSNIFDMRAFYKQLPTPLVEQAQTQERKKMLGVLSAAGKRRSIHF